jgi:hypothetical protein
MKRDIPKLFVVVVAFAAAALLPPATAAAEGDGPAVHLSPWCTSVDPPVPNYGVYVWVTGLAPHATFTGELRFGDPEQTTYHSNPTQADAFGNWGPFGAGETSPVPSVKATLWYDGGEYTATMEHPCEGSNVEAADPPWPPYTPDPPPADFSPTDDLNISAPPAPKVSRKHLTAKRQCKHRGWKRYGFKNRKRCVAFVKHAHRS